MFNKTKVTNVVRDDYNRLMHNCEKHGIARRNGFLYKDGNHKYVLRVPATDVDKRDIKYISPEELAVGLLVFIKQNITVDKMGLFSTLAKELGYQRLSDSMIERFEEALGILDDMVERDGDQIRKK